MGNKWTLYYIIIVLYKLFIISLYLLGYYIVNYVNKPYLMGILVGFNGIIIHLRGYYTNIHQQIDEMGFHGIVHGRFGRYEWEN